MKKLIITAALAALAFFQTAAQTLQTGYFLENYVFSYQLNPASHPAYAKGFVGIGVDNLSIGLNSNIGLNKLVFPVTVDGRKALVTGFNENVPAEQFLGGLNPVNKAVADLSLNVLSLGFSGEDHFCTIEVNVRGDVMAGIPKDIFSILKTAANQDGTYSVRNTTLGTTEYAEFVFGYSRDLSDRFSMGFRVKALAGLADASLTLDSINAKAHGSQVDFSTSGTLDFSALGLQFKPDASGYVDFDDVLDNARSFKPGGYGVAFDLGAEARLLDDKLTLSASALDLGGLFWQKNCRAVSDFSGTLGSEDSPEFSDLFKVESDSGSRFAGIGPKVNVGAKYKLAKMLSVGMLASTRFGRYKVSEARLGAAFTPGKTLSLAVSGAVNSFGTSFGCALSLRFLGLNLFAGTDSIVTSFTPEYVPIEKVNTRLNAGLVIAF